MSIFQKVERNKAKARIAISGVSGSGKTLGSLRLAWGMAGSWDKVALIDTEHERARFYADRSDLGVGVFLYAPLHPPYYAEKYIRYIEDAAKVVGPDGVLIIDSFSHAWNGDGGVLDYKNEIAKRPGKTEYTAWDEAGKLQKSLINAVFSANCHAILTLRVKMNYVLEENEKGKLKPRQVGLAPIQRDETEYEFDIILDIDRLTHCASVGKQSGYFTDNFYAPLSAEIGEQLVLWLNKGVEPPRCAACGKVVYGNERLTRDEIVKRSTEKTGKPLCIACANDWARENAKAVSNESA